MKSDITLVSRSRPDFEGFLSTTALFQKWPKLSLNEKNRPIATHRKSSTVKRVFPLSACLPSKTKKGHYAQRRAPLLSKDYKAKMSQSNNSNDIKLNLSAPSVNRYGLILISHLLIYIFTETSLLSTQIHLKSIPGHNNPATKGVPDRLQSIRYDCRSYRSLKTLRSPAAGLPGCY